MLNSLKLIDIYSVDKKFNVSDHQNCDHNKKEFLNKDKVGSNVGGAFSLILYAMVVY